MFNSKRYQFILDFYNKDISFIHLQSDINMFDMFKAGSDYSPALSFFPCKNTKATLDVQFVYIAETVVIFINIHIRTNMLKIQSAVLTVCILNPSHVEIDNYRKIGL